MSEFAPVRYGILSAANIARQFTRGVAGSALARVVAVASRGQGKADAFAAELGIPRALGSYEALLADPEVEAVYIPLPNDMHAEWAVRAAEAGKHILCEKPLCIGGADARRMFAAARAHGVHLAEAYPYMSQPQTLRLRALLAEGAIGRVQIVQSSFGFGLVSPEGAPLGNPDNIRLLPERGGGALLDAGTYSMSLARIALGERPVRVFAAARWTQSGVDQTVAATLTTAGGAIAQVTCCMSGAVHRHAIVVGETGVIETTYSNHQPPGARLALRIKRGAPNAVPFDVEEVDGGDGFRLEAESFARLVRTGAGWNGATEAESIDTSLALEAVAKSSQKGGWVEVGAG